MENDQMTTELQYQSKETERIVSQNHQLASENSSLKRERELAISTQQLMAKKNMFYQQLIAKLQRKLEQIQQEREKERQMFAAMQMQQQQIMQQQQSAQGGGKPHGGTATLSQILRGVDEMAALAQGQGSATPILPRSISGAGQGQGGRRSGMASSSGSGGAGMASSSSLSSSGGGSSSHGLGGVAHPQGSQEDAATIARLTDRLTSLERDKIAWLDAHRALTSSVRDAQRGQRDAEAHVLRLQAELNELQQTVARMRTHKSQGFSLSDSALQFISSCLEDQRLQLSGAAESAALAKADEAAAVLAPVAASGSENTIVVNGPGERAVAGGAAAILGSANSPPRSTPGSPRAGGRRAGGAASSGVSQKGYPASFVDFSAEQRALVLEHLLQQLSAFAKASPDAIRGMPVRGGAEPISPSEQQQQQSYSQQQQHRPGSSLSSSSAAAQQQHRSGSSQSNRSNASERER